jgi:hypothetical protein
LYAVGIVVNGQHEVVNGQHEVATVNTRWSTVNTRRSTVNTRWSTVNTRWSTVNTRWSTVNRTRARPLLRAWIGRVCWECAVDLARTICWAGRREGDAAAVGGGSIWE